MLNYCEEVVWQRGAHRRSGIRHLFIIRSLLLFCREILVAAGRPVNTTPLTSDFVSKTKTPPLWRWNFEIIYVTSKNTVDLIF